MAIASVAIAAQKPSSNVTFCAAKRGGNVSVAKRGRCSRRQTKLVVSKRGPAGPRGAQGVAGAAGSPGKDGTPADLAPEARRLVGAGVPGYPPGNTNCQANLGTFCGIPTCAYDWRNYFVSGFAPVAYQRDSGGYIHLQGIADSISSGGTCFNPGDVAFYLPVGYRPTDGTHRFTANKCYAGLPVTTVEIGVGGAVFPAAGSTCVNLDGIVFHP